MFPRLKDLPEKYYQFWIWLANLKNKIHILPVNFNHSWTTIILRQKLYLSIALLCEMLVQVFYTLVPLLIGWIIEQNQFYYLVYLIAGWLLAIIGEYVTIYYATLLEQQCINSIQYNAYEFFLTVDPIYHSTRSTGKLFAKIERAARSYEDFLDNIMLDLAPTTIGVITVVGSFFWINSTLGLLALTLLLLVAALNITLNLFTGKAFETNVIKADDTMKALSVESLTQVQLIRSCFASNEIAQKVKNKNHQLMVTEGSGWLAFSAINFITRIAYLASITLLGYAVIQSISKGAITTLIGTTLLITYIRGTYEIIKIGRKLRKLIKSITRIKDLFAFIQSFGQRTFPVLKHQLEQKHIPIEQAIEANTIELKVQELYFDYSPKAKIFQNHTMYLAIPVNQKNKLYGIIGPSGMGKTTFLSLLGGQLKPTRGSIELNGISVYSIDDTLRRKLIAIQGQIASNLSGTLRSNLLIGLPKDKHIYTDEAMITVLQEVGIWTIFEEKNGLDTPIGEGGLTLSGGQRQRLNFAGLYLRARYYKPLLILIDEPTSSLDEVSERAITGMIHQLAQDSLTLVIAHRLKTLEAAIAILDFSLLDKSKNIQFLPIDELKQKSSYYQRLIEGQVDIGT